MHRRTFLKILGKTTLSMAVAAAGGLEYITRVEPGWIQVTKIDLPLKRLAGPFAGLRLAQISDIHQDNWMNSVRLDRLVRLILSLKPDVVAITGDFVIGHGWKEEHATYLDQLARGLRPLSQACKTVAVLGNHDHWSCAGAVRAMLSAAGIVDLSNSVDTLQRGTAQLHLCGVDDIYARQERLSEVLERLPESGAAILLAHEPDFADTSAKSERFDLQLSGHSHGGQVVFPIVGPLVLPKYGKKYPSGLYTIQEMHLYTNRGVGMVPVFVRFNCRPEIALFTLTTPAA
jgi:uncharacterized protein